jgi:hypothetical protein
VSKTVEIPSTLFAKFLRAGEALSDLHEDFENYLISTNPALLRKLHKARREHLGGRTRPFDELKRELKCHPSRPL